MYRQLILGTALFLAACDVSTPREPQSAGFLRAEGQRIVDADGNEVLLRGVGLGGWMLQEGYMLRTRGPQYRIEADIEALVGKERKEEFYEAWLANHTREIDIDSMKAWGFNSVRLPMHYKWFTPPIEEEPVPGEITWIEKGFEMTDALLEWAGKNEMYLILDLHATPGGQGKNADINDYNPEKPSLWESEANQEKTIALWRKLAERYRDEPWIGGYDMINEPNWGFADIENDPNGCSEEGNEPLWEIQRRITEAIREVDTNHIIIIEGNCWGNNYRSLPPLWDDNVVVSYHKYWNYNTVEEIQHMLDMRAERNVPIWLGETGENSNTWFTNAIQLLESHDIGWAWWPLKKIGTNQPLEIVANDAYMQTARYFQGRGERPDPDEAFAGLMEVAEKLKLENNVVHRDVIDAMIRQPHTAEVLPWKRHVVSGDEIARILAVDYDLGRNGYAYLDADTANYRTSGVNSAGNRGFGYRNDGVDIGRTDMGDLYVGWTEPGEWLQYTIEVEDAGTYAVGIESAHGESAGVVSLSVGDERVLEGVALESGGEQWTSTNLGEVDLSAGTNRIRVMIDEGGFDLRALVLGQ